MSKDIYAEVTNAIIAQLEQGVAPWRKPWVSLSGDMPSNLKSKRPYRGINQLLLSMMPYSSPWWVTFKQAREFGGCVRKGEKATMVVFWKRLKVADPDSERGFKIIPMIRYYSVFNTEQCDGVTVPAATERPDFNPVSEAEHIVAQYAPPIGPEVKHGGDTACWIPLFDEIRMPEREAFKSPALYYSILFHEMTHSTGHESRLARADVCGKITFGDEKYSREELTAEMGAAMLSAHAGLLPETIQDSVSYIANWLQVFKNDPKMVVLAAQRAQRAADMIMGITFDDAEQEADNKVAVAA